MRKILLLMCLLLLRNKWLILMLTVWPLAIALVIRFAGAGMNRDDVSALLGQESLYGIAMVAFAGSALLGAEERSGRIQNVLARAVSRSAYLGGLLLGAWVPLVLYVAGFCAAGFIFEQSGLKGLWPLIGMLAGRQLLVGLLVAAVSIFASVLLSTPFASVLTIFMAAAVEYVVVSNKLGLMATAAVSLPAAALLFSAGCALFARQDLRLHTG